MLFWITCVLDQFLRFLGIYDARLYVIVFLYTIMYVQLVITWSDSSLSHLWFVFLTETRSWYTKWVSFPGNVWRNTRNVLKDFYPLFIQESESHFCGGQRCCGNALLTLKHLHRFTAAQYNPSLPWWPLSSWRFKGLTHLTSMKVMSPGIKLSPG